MRWRIAIVVVLLATASAQADRVDIDWTAPNDNRWLVRWGGGLGAVKLLTKKAGLAYEIQAFWNIVRPNPGALWQLRFQLAFFFPRLRPKP